MTQRPEHIVWFSWKDYWHPQAGGAEVVAHQLMTRLVADGHKVTLLTANYKGASKTANYEIVRTGTRVSVYVAAARYYLKHLKSTTTLVVDECNTVPFFAGWYAGCRHINFFHMLCRKIWFYELPKVLSAIGWLAEPVYLRMLKPGPAITVSESTKQDLIRHGFKPEDIHIISEGLELAPVKSLRTKKFATPTVLSLGTMRSMKRTLDQVGAFEITKQDIKNLQLIIAGDSNTPYGKLVKRAIRRSKYKDDIILKGRVSQSEKLDLMRRSHALLVTSVKEGWGLVVTEANSQGTPAVAYNVDGLRDSVKDGKTGILTAESSPNLAIGIHQLLTNQAKYAKIRAAAYADSKSITFTNAYADFKKGADI